MNRSSPRCRLASATVDARHNDGAQFKGIHGVVEQSKVMAKLSLIAITQVAEPTGSLASQPCSLREGSFARLLCESQVDNVHSRIIGMY